MPDYINTATAQAIIETLCHSLWQVGLLFLLWRMVFSAKGKHLDALKKQALYIFPFLVFLFSIVTFYAVSSPLLTTSTLLGGDLLSTASTQTDSWSPWIIKLIISIWVAGVFIQGIRLLHSYINLRIFRKRTFSMADHALVQLTYDLAKRMNISQNIQIRFSSDISSPLVAGLFRPLILFPFCLVNQLSLEEAEAILVHELNHVKNHDYLFNIYLSFLEIIFFFNPFVLHLVREVRTEREIACDQAALNNNSNKTLFAATLIRIQEIQMDVRPALGLQGEGEFSYRIKRILGLPSSRPTVDSKSLIKSFSFLAVLPFLFSFMHIQDVETEVYSDAITTLGIDTIRLPQVEKEIYSLEYKSIDGKIKELLVNEEEVHSPSREQEESLKKSNSEATTSNNRFEEYQAYLNKSLPANKEQLKISRQRKALKSRKSNKHPQAENTSVSTDDLRAISFNNSLERGYHFGKSFDTLLLEIDEEVLLIGDKKWHFTTQLQQFKFEDDFKTKHIIVIPNATEGTKGVNNVVIHYESLVKEVLAEIRSNVDHNTSLDDNIEQQLISWNIVKPNESFSMTLTKDYLIVNGRIQDMDLQQNLATYYLEYTGKNPRSIFNYQIIKNN